MHNTLKKKNRMKDLGSQLELVETTIDKVTKSKEEKANELSLLIEQVILKYLKQSMYDYL